MKATGQNRSDVLTVTYFIDARRKRHVEISLGRLRILLVTVATLSGIGLWTLGGALGRRAARSTAGPHRVDVASTSNAVLSAAASAGSAAPVRDASRTAAEPPVIGPERGGAEPRETVARVEPVTAAKSPVTVFLDDAPPIAAAAELATARDVQPAVVRVAIRELSLQHAPGRLEARFAIENQAADTAEGRVTGTATFVASTGASLRVASEEEPTFRARRHTLKELRFLAPASTAGRFQALEVTVHGLPGFMPKTESRTFD